MADYVLIRKSRNIFSSFLHLAFNIALGVGSVLITVVTASWIPGIVLVLISKWRTFAVRFRYLLLNIKASLVDLIVGVSFVMLTYCSGTEIMPVHYILAGAYTFWLVVIKPRSSEIATEIQALFAVFLGTAAATLMAASADSIFMAAICFLIGYAAAHHILVQTDDENYELIPLAAGLVFAEIAWLCHSWLIVYQFNEVGLMVPQLSLLLTIISFTFGFTYRSILKHSGKLVMRDVAMPALWAILVVTVIIIWFSVPKFNV